MWFNKNMSETTTTNRSENWALAHNAYTTREQAIEMAIQQGYTLAGITVQTTTEILHLVEITNGVFAWRKY